MPADLFLAALDYSTFIGEFEETTRELNRQQSK